MHDLVWEKSAPVWFLCAKNMPMRKHEMICVFYENLLLYDISSHNHKFVKMVKPSTVGTDHPYGGTNGGEKGCYDPPLPTSVIKRSNINCLYHEGV